MLKRTALIGAFLALVAGLSGCGRGGGNKPKFAFISNNVHGFWTYAQRGCEKAAKELDVEVEFHRPDPDTLAKQQQIIEDLLLRGIDGLAISPNDPSNMAVYLKDKVSSKVPVIAADNDVPDTSARKVYIGTHNYRAGRAAGELVKKALPKGGKIAIFVGHMNATNAKERRQGVLDVLAGIERSEMGAMTPADAMDLKVGAYLLVDTRTDGGKETVCQEKAQDLLRVQPDIDCLIGLWEYNPPALLRAVKGLKTAKKPQIVAFDENFQTMDGILAGEIVGSIAQDPFDFGYKSVKILASIHKKEDLKAFKMDADNRIYIEHTIVTPENVGAFYERLKELRKG